jgi:hypothetical protein
MPPTPGNQSCPATRNSTFHPGGGFTANPTKSNQIKVNQAKKPTKTVNNIIAYRPRAIQPAADACWRYSDPASAPPPAHL